MTTNTPTTVTLEGKSGYPDAQTPGTLTYQLLSQPAHGTVTNFNSSAGTFTYTPDTGYGGLDSLTYQVTATGPQTSPATTVSNPGAVTFGVNPVNTGAVSQIGNALVVTPVPRTDRGTNTIVVDQVRDSTSATGFELVVSVNGAVDDSTFSTSDINRIIVFGGKNAKNQLILSPTVTVPATMSTGQGFRNRLTGGAGATQENGWFGNSTLIAGTGKNQLVGLAGHVRFKPSKATTEIFAGTPQRRTNQLNAVPPTGTFYKYVRGHLIPVSPNVFKPPKFNGHKLEE